MDALMKLSREVQIVLGGGLVLLILSFLDWQKAGLVGLNEWHGIGVLAALLVIAMLVWEGMRLMEVKVELGTLTPGLVSLGLALLVAVLTFVAFLDKSASRSWPAWTALIVAIIVALAAVRRSQGEKARMPEMKASDSTGSTEP